MRWYDYVADLRDAAAGLPVAERGAFWASVVSSALGHEDSGHTGDWAQRRVEATTGTVDRSRFNVVLAAIDNVSTDAQVATDFLAALGEHEQWLTDRLPDELSADIATRALNHLDFDSEARKKVASWALNRIADPSMRQDAVMRALNPQQGTQFLDLLVVVRGLELLDTRRVEGLEGEDQNPLITGKVDAIEAVLEAAAAREALRLRQRERERLLREDPVAVFAQLAAEARPSLENAAEFDMTTVHPDMWKALYRLVRDVPNSDPALLPELARTVLNQAVVQRAAGVSFLNAGELKEADSVLDRYQELPVLAADSLEEFQRQLDVLRQVREGRVPEVEDAERRLFLAWRTSFIDRKLGARPADAFAAEQDWQGLQFPLECAQVTVEVSEGFVTYSNVDELLAAIRRYSGPNLRADVDELEAAIQGWHEDGSPESYDDADYGGGPRGRGGALFYGHDIHLTRAGKDAVKLRFSPGDYGHRGIRMLEGFAAFDNGKTVRIRRPDRAYLLH